MNKIAVALNIYIDTTSEIENIFDHPTTYFNFESGNTFTQTFSSL